MKRNSLFLIIVIFFTLNAKSQVTIGSNDLPTKGAVLELKSGSLGFLPPRVHLSKLSLPDPLPTPHVEGMVVYNLRVSAQDTLQRGLYYNDGTRWLRLSTTTSFSENWFYMPSIVFDTSETTNAPQYKDLYGEFRKQLNDNTNANVVASSGAPNKVLSTIPAREDL